jgi:hypothetical protein
LTRKAVFDKLLSARVGTTQIEAPMYRIVKRIVHTITTVTWLVRWEDDSLEQKYAEKEITFPASVSVTEEEVTDTINHPKKTHQSSNPTLDKGEKP